MQGKQVFQQPLFTTIDLNKFVPDDHPLKRIEKVLDLSYIRALTKPYYSENIGRASLDPVVFFKMEIIKYLEGIDSDRKLCADAHLNMAYRWFLRIPVDDPIPDHSTLTKIRDRLGEDVYKQCFEQIVWQCKEAGLLRNKQMVTDGTLIEANASKKSLKPRQENKSPGSKCKKKEKISNVTHVSKSDPDATIVGRKGYGGKLYYKSHCSIMGNKRIITDCYVTTGATHECQTYTDRIEHQISTFELEVKECLADRGYGHGPAYEYLKKNEIRAYIPLRDNRLGRGKDAPSEGFIYNRKQDIYTCPKGHKLHPHKPSTGFTRYRITGGECINCPIRSECMPEGSKLSNKRILRSFHQDSYDKIHRRSKTKHFKKKLRERAWRVEGVFGEDKINHGLSRARYRGRSKVQMQVYMISFVHNLKRLAQGLSGLKSPIFWSDILNMASKFGFWCLFGKSKEFRIENLSFLRLARIF